MKNTNDNSNLPWLDKNKELYAYMLEKGISDPLKATPAEVKQIFLALIEDCKNDAITVPEFLELVFPLWSAPGAADTRDTEKIKNLLLDAENIETQLHSDAEYIEEHKDKVLKSFFDFLTENR